MSFLNRIIRRFQPTKVPSIFADQNLQDRFDREGYVVVDFLSDTQIESIKKIYAEYFSELPEGQFGSSSYMADKKLKIEMSDKIHAVIESSLEKYFNDYTPFGSAFLYKTPGDGSELAMHQDWTIVDEKKAVALNIWFPLVDVSEENGTLSVLPRSHSRRMFTLRAPTLPFFFQNREEMMKKYLKPLTLVKGEAIVLNQSLVHYSGPNRSDKTRPAVTSGIKTKGAEMIFFYKDNSKEHSRIEKFKMDEDFLNSFDDFFNDIRNRPDIAHSEFIGATSQKVLSDKELEAFLQSTVED